MRRFITASLALLAPLVCLSENDTRVDGVAAYVNSHTITITDVIKSSRALQQKLTEGISDPAVLNSLYTNALDTIIDHKLILDDYENQKKIKIPEEAFLDRENAIIDEMFNGNRSDFLDALAADHITEEQWRANMREKSIVTAMRNVNVESKVSISPLAAYELYRKNSDKYTTQPAIKMKMMVIAKGNSPSEKSIQKKKMVAVLKALKNGGEFSTLAKKYSEDHYAAKGGSRGWTKRDMLREDLAKVAFAAKPGAVRVVDIGNTYCIIEIDDKVDEKKIPFEEARPLIEDQLRQDAAQKLYYAWIERLRKYAYIKVVNASPF